MTIHLALIAAIGIIGFLAGGALGAAALVMPWAAVVIVCGGLKLRRMRIRSGIGNWPLPDVYLDVEEINDGLDDLARQRGWDFDKRMEIAFMACENRAATIDELERHYDSGLRSAFVDMRQEALERPKNDRPV